MKTYDIYSDGKLLYTSFPATSLEHMYSILIQQRLLNEGTQVTIQRRIDES